MRSRPIGLGPGAVARKQTQLAHLVTDGVFVVLDNCYATHRNSLPAASTDSQTDKLREPQDPCPQ